MHTNLKAHWPNALWQWYLDHHNLCIFQVHKKLLSQKFIITLVHTILIDRQTLTITDKTTLIRIMTNKMVQKLDSGYKVYFDSTGSMKWSVSKESGVGSRSASYLIKTVVAQGAKLHIRCLVTYCLTNVQNWNVEIGHFLPIS